MALASGFFPRPSYTPGASQCAPFFLGFGFDGECCDPSFAAYYDYEEYAPSGQSPLTSSKDYTSSSPLQSPEPDYTPSSPDYAPASPAYTPASPSPSLEYTSSSPVRLVFMMPSPPRGASPDYTPLTPSEHAASSPYYTPSSPPGPGRASWPDYTPSTPPPSPLAVSDAESCASPYYTPSTPSRRAESPDYTPSTPPPSPLASEAESSMSTAVKIVKFAVYSALPPPSVPEKRRQSDQPWRTSASPGILTSCNKL
nr:DNA-directed RNA polymerase II subunit RPB1-like [Aegilops tauschii subsp. strangulata]